MNPITGRVFPSSSLSLSPGLSFEAWKELGKSLKTMRTGAHFLIGQWLAYGESEHTSRYKEAIKEVGLSYGSLRNIKYVSINIELSNRYDNLRFGHYLVLASLSQEKQRELALIASKDRLSVRALAALAKGRVYAPAISTCPACGHVYQLTGKRRNRPELKVIGNG